MVKLIKKYLLKIVIAFITLGLLTSGVLVYQGYKRYEEAVTVLPVLEAGNQILNKENFVNFEEIDEDFINALVAIEDNRFFERKGIDFYAIARALVFNILSGKISQGGSTITQQLAKNIYFSHKKSLTRKIAEVFFVEDFEDNFTHQEILAMYANIIYYGDGYNGIYEACLGYFDKAANDLTLYEASLLAGMPQSPSKYQLSNGYTEANKRQKLVLDAMKKYGYINEKEYAEALSLQPLE